MAFTGTAVIKLVSESKTRITGLSLLTGASGTISLHEGTGSVKCPEAFKPRPYDDGFGDVSLQDSVEVSVWPVDGAGEVGMPFKIVKSGTTPADFLVTITDTSTEEEIGTGEFEIYLKFH